MEQGAQHHASAAWWAFVCVAALVLPIVILASFDFGVTWDERTRHQYGERIWGYFSGLRRRSSFGDDPYAGLFDVICVAFERWLPVNRYVLRHAINAIFGWVGVVYCGRLAARLFGPWSGVLAMILLAASPRYFADSMNNPKDLPFAAMTITALYYLSTVSPTWPYISQATGIKIAVALALGLNIRPGALIFLGYFGMLVIAFVIAERNANWRRLADTALRLAAVAAAVLLLGTVFWPWAQDAPLTRPVQALLRAANYRWHGKVLFNGDDLAPDELPWYYVPWWLLISTPPVVIAGALLSLFVSSSRGWTLSFKAQGDAGPNLPWYSAPGSLLISTPPVVIAGALLSGLVARSREWTLSRNALWLAAVLPVVLVIVKGSTLYDGIRHLLFIYPILVVLAASGWAACLLEPNRPWLRRSAGALLAAGLVNILIFDVRFHPNQTVYFNGLVGGPRGAFARFDMDYWGNCILEAVAWSAKTARLSGRPIAISGFPSHLVQLNATRFPELFFTPQNDGKNHLTVLLNRNSAEQVTELANREDALYRVQTADGAVLCVVLPGPAFEELRPHLSLSPAQSSPHQPNSR